MLFINISAQLLAVCIHEKKRTMGAIVKQLFTFERDDDASVNMSDIKNDIEFIRDTKSNLIGSVKEKFCFIFVNNNSTYLKVLDAQWRAVDTKRRGLEFCIDKKLGSKSISGKFCKVRLFFSLDSNEYFASMIRDYCFFYRKHEQVIANIMISRFEYDLDSIQRKFDHMKYGRERTLKEWIRHKSGESMSGFFLIQMLEKCIRYRRYESQYGDVAKKNTNKIAKMLHS